MKASPNKDGMRGQDLANYASEAKCNTSTIDTTNVNNSSLLSVHDRHHRHMTQQSSLWPFFGTAPLLLCLLLFTSRVALAQNNDLFSYERMDHRSNGRVYRGQQNWDNVNCGNPGTCTGFPNKFPAVQLNSSYYGWNIDIDGNGCKWCPDTGSHTACGVHRQSPIDLKRFPSEPGHPGEKECRDWHWMQYKDDTCSWDDMLNSFVIGRHALQLYIPVKDNGLVDCWEQGNGRRFPRLDYSKGFPDWWWLARTDISVPSQHTQEGKQYAAEVTLAHFYQIAHEKNEMGHVTLFMQDYPDAESWPFLDKLICQWREKEDIARAACGETPAPPYGRCRIFSERGQVPTQEWLEEAGITEPPTFGPTASPVFSPTSAPTSAPSKVPTSPPSKTPTVQPTLQPAPQPTISPVDAPTTGPTTAPPSTLPSESPSARPTLIPSSIPSETASPSDSPSFLPSVSAMPTSAPVSQPDILIITDGYRAQPTVPPTQGIVIITDSGVDEAAAGMGPPSIACGEYEGLIPGGYERMCHGANPCCEETRAHSNYCLNIYENIFLGDSIYSACYHCCPDEQKIVGDPNPPHDEIGPKSVDCSAYSGAQRYCKSGSCCAEIRSETPFCSDAYAAIPDEAFNQICWYCCSDPVELGPSLARTTTTQGEIQPLQRRNLRSQPKKNSEVVEGSVITYVDGIKYQLLPQDLAPADEDPEEYFHRIYDDYNHRHRKLQGVVHEEDYADVEYWPYEWMLKVGTEYYYRYEGTQVVPPCREFVHWRLMKDPIRVHARQIAELNRLMAWRLDPSSCNVDTAGVLSNDGNTVKVDRDIQYRHKGHRDVFCECKDWPSKFANDVEWCDGWEEDTNHDRFYTRPYSYDSDGWGPTYTGYIWSDES